MLIKKLMLSLFLINASVFAMNQSSYRELWYKPCLKNPQIKLDYQCSFGYEYIPTTGNKFISHRKAKEAARNHLFDAYILSNDRIISLEDKFIALRSECIDELRYKPCNVYKKYLYPCDLPYDEIETSESTFTTHSLAVNGARDFLFDAYVLNDGRIIALRKDVQETIGRTTPTTFFSRWK